MGFPRIQPEATSPRSRRTKVGMISLGCAKNLVDAEIMLGNVLQHGMEITSDADDADVLVINTCAFIDSAKEESIDAILEAHQQRETGRHAARRAGLAGHLVERAGRQAELPVRLHPPGRAFLVVGVQPAGDGEDGHQPDGEAHEGAAHPVGEHRQGVHGFLRRLGR